jgi:hypothetical protein
MRARAGRQPEAVNLKEDAMKSALLTSEEVEEVVFALRYAIDEGVGYGHCLPGDEEYVEGEQKRIALLRKFQRMRVRSRKRKAAHS